MAITMSAISAWAWKKFENYDVEKMYRSQGAVGRVWDYYNIVKDMIDSRKRSGGFLKLGIKVTMDIAGKAADFNLTSHPYFTYHKAHIQALADALNAQANSKAAIEAFNKAVAAADSSSTVGGILTEYKKRTGVLGLQYASFADALSLWQDLNAGGAAASSAVRTINQYGLSMDEIRASESNLKAWRAGWLGLYFESVQTLTMAETEAGTAAEAVAEFKKILADMAKGSNLSKVAGKATEQEMYWEQYDRMVKPSSKQPEQAILDPTKYAESKRADANTVTRAVADMCTFVLTKDVRDRDTYIRQAAALAKVLSTV